MLNRVRLVVGSIAVVALSLGAFGGSSLASTTRHATSGTVIFIGPETYTGRWPKDDTYVKAQVAKQCPSCSYVFQNGNSQYSTQLQDFQQDLSEISGKKVLILAAVDSTLDSGIVDLAAQNHVPVIAYDRMIEDPKISAYVSFNASQVGQIQAKYLLYALAQKKVTSGNIVQIWGASTDNNAILFQKGFNSIFGKHLACPAKSPDSCGTSKPLYKDAYHIFTPDWTPQVAENEIQSALSNLSNKVVAVYSMNDGMADPISPQLTSVGLGSIPLTGQDAQPTGLARILTGHQGMDVYKPPAEEGVPAVKAALWFMNGKKGMPKGFTTKNSQCKQTVKPHRSVPCVIGGVDAITNYPIKSLGSHDVSFPVSQGYDTWSDVCSQVYPTPPSTTAPYCGLKH